MARSSCATSVRRARLSPRSNRKSTRALYSGGPGVVGLDETGAKQIQMIAAERQHRVGPEPSGDEIRVGDRHARRFAIRSRFLSSASATAASSVRRSDDGGADLKRLGHETPAGTSTSATKTTGAQTNLTTARSAARRAVSGEPVLSGDNSSRFADSRPGVLQQTASLRRCILHRTAFDSFTAPVYSARCDASCVLASRRETSLVQVPRQVGFLGCQDSCRRTLSMSGHRDGCQAPWAALVVDDDAGVRQSLRLCLEAAGARVLGVATGGAALEALDRGHFDVVFLDLWLGADAGLDLLPEMLQRQADLGVIVVTAFASIESAVDAVKRGAVDYIPKPFTPDQIRLTANRVVEAQRLRRRLAELQQELDESGEPSRLRVAQSDLSAVSSSGRSRGGVRRGRLASRRKRHGQERPGALVARQQSARGSAVRDGQLPRALRRSDDQRALWTPEGRVYRALSPMSRERSRKPKAAHCFSTKSAN